MERLRCILLCAEMNSAELDYVVSKVRVLPLSSVFIDKWKWKMEHEHPFFNFNQKWKKNEYMNAVRVATK